MLGSSINTNYQTLVSIAVVSRLGESVYKLVYFTLIYTNLLIDNINETVVTGYTTGTLFTEDCLDVIIFEYLKIISKNEIIILKVINCTLCKVNVV